MQAKPNFIVPLSDASAGLSQVGGKGASLARMAAAAVIYAVGRLVGVSLAG